MATPLANLNRKVVVAADLLGLKSQGESAIAQLNRVKTNLLNLKKAVNAEAIFDAEEEAEVQAVIVDLAAQIQAILGG